jgi:tetratricopeptide (TPR) repeat protein
LKKLFWVNLFVLLFSSCITNEERVDIVIEYYNVGNAFFEADQLEKAAEYYKKVLNIDSDYHKARYNLIHLQIKQSDFKSANKNIRYLKELDAMNLKIKKLEAYIRYSEGDLENALDLYLEAYYGGDVSEDLRLNIVKLYYQLGFYDEAITFVSDLLVGKEDKSLYYLAGLVAEGSEDFDIATKYYQSYITLGGDSLEVLKSLVVIYESQKDYDNLKLILELLIDNKDEELKADSLFKMALIVLLHNNDFSLGYDFLEDAIDAGFDSVDRIEELLNEPDLIELDKIRQLFIENKIIK